MLPLDFANCHLARVRCRQGSSPGATATLCLYFVLACLLLLAPLSRADDILIGVRAHNGLDYASRRWTPTIAYLQQHIPEHQFSLQPVEHIEDMAQLVKSNRLDFVITQPVAYIDLERQFGASRLLTLQKKGNLTQFGSVIISRADRDDIQTLADVRGKSIAGVTPKGFGGWLIGYQELQDHGIKSHRSFKDISFVGGQDEVVMAVVNGASDIGIARTGIIERLAANNQLDMAQLRVLNPQTVAGFPYLLSTRLYPEWAFAKTRKVSDEVAKRVATVLLSIPKNGSVATAGQYSQWNIPLNYNAVRTLMKEQRVGSYAHFGEVSLGQIASQYRNGAFFFALLIVGLVLHIVQTRRSNRLLTREKTEKELAFQLMEHMAKHDALTDLPNRYLINELIENQLQLAHRNRTKIGLLFIDLDGFKAINDLYGHEVGDQVLCETAKLLKSSTRDSDLSGRLGGDEFVMSIYGLEDIKELEKFSVKLIQRLGSLEALKDRAHKVSASIGGVITSATKVDIEKLIIFSDNLMYKAKTSGKGRAELTSYP